MPPPPPTAFFGEREGAVAPESGQQYLDAEMESSFRTSLVKQQSNKAQLLGADGLPRRDLGLPTLNGEKVASLSTCFTNMDRSCDFHTVQKYRIYRSEWVQPAPQHCEIKRRKPAPPLPELHTDRLGVNMEPTCDNL